MKNSKSKQEIEMRFSKEMDLASEIERLADDLSRVANSGVEPALLVLQNSLKGDAGGSMGFAGKKTTDRIYRTADDLLRVATSIRTTADIVYKAEKAAAGLCF